MYSEYNFLLDVYRFYVRLAFCNFSRNLLFARFLRVLPSLFILILLIS